VLVKKVHGPGSSLIDWNTTKERMNIGHDGVRRLQQLSIPIVTQI
jgi:hypothetical protein